MKKQSTHHFGSGSFWTKPLTNPILSPSQPWEENDVLEPSVIYENGIFKMWYSGGTKKCAVGYATSKDGVTWSKYEHNPIYGFGRGGEDGAACQNNVVKYKDTYYLFYANKTLDLHVATSQDGIHFTKHSRPVLIHLNNAWDSQIANSYQWVEGDTWYMLYEAGGNDPSKVWLWKLGLATGKDPFTWTKYNGNPLDRLQIGKGMYGGPWVKKIGDVYYLWHQASIVADTLPTDIYLHTSPDLFHWNQIGTTSANVYRTQSNWEIDQTADPFIVEAHGKTFMYYDGDDNSPKTGYRAWIGYVYHDGPLMDITKF